VPPAPPANLKAVAGDEAVVPSWTESQGAAGYAVYRGTSSGAEGSASIATVTAASYRGSGLANGATYYYVVAAVNGAGTSVWSNEMAATPRPLAITGAPKVTIGGTTATVEWNTNTPATSVLQFGTNPDNLKWVSSNATPVTRFEGIVPNDDLLVCVFVEFRKCDPCGTRHPLIHDPVIQAVVHHQNVSFPPGVAKQLITDFCDSHRNRAGGLT
jgi:hypothetical protein